MLFESTFETRRGEKLTIKAANPGPLPISMVVAVPGTQAHVIHLEPQDARALGELLLGGARRVDMVREIQAADEIRRLKEA